MKIKNLCILGGTGFVGRHLVARLVNSGCQITLPTRRRERHRDFLVMPGVRLVEADVSNEQTLKTLFTDCDAVINLIGILNGSESKFRAVHTDLPRQVAEVARDTGVKRLLHMCALGADLQAPSQYLRSKAAGEQAVFDTAGDALAVTSFRPSVIFGPDDSFLNRFADLLKLAPVLPLACPEARFAPVYVQDVVRAFEVALTEPKTYRQRLELCGPHSYTLKQLVEYTAQVMGLRRLVIGLSDKLSLMQGQVFEKLPGQIFTTDNYRSMQVPSVCQHNALPDLGINPHALESIAPRYLGGKAGRYARYQIFRGVARRD